MDSKCPAIYIATHFAKTLHAFYSTLLHRSIAKCFKMHAECFMLVSLVLLLLMDYTGMHNPFRCTAPEGVALQL